MITCIMHQGFHQNRTAAITAIVTLTLILPRPALAGMPSATLTDLASARLQTISFFLLLLLLGAAAVRLIWNWLRQDFSRLPRLSYPRALALVSLWGCLFAFVLTMISGARELLTPAAWERDGAVYRIARSDNKDPEADAAVWKQTQARRQERIAALKALLWNYAASHSGELPPNDRVPEIAATAWETSDPSRIRFVYVPGRKAGIGNDIVAYEPAAAFWSDRWVLTSDGQMTQMSYVSLTQMLGQTGAP